MLPPSFALFLVIGFEGYAVLASELLAIRLLLPHVGSGVEVVSIIISGVLLPLAYGYYVGGRRFGKSQKIFSIRRLLIKNFLSASIILLFGLSYLFLELFFGKLLTMEINHPLIQTTIYTALFLVYPTYLLGQTVPLASHYFRNSTRSQTTGNILFISTMGSFLGSVLSTILLMNWIGVHATASCVITLLCISILLLSKRLYNSDAIIAMAVAACAIFINHPMHQKKIGMVMDNAYNTATISETENTKALVLNHNKSTVLTTDPAKRHPYIAFIEDYIITPLEPGKEILVLGAGGFSLGLDHPEHHFTFIDIDAELKTMTERHLLGKALPSNITFKTSSARAFIKRDTQQYDMVIVDLYTNKNAIPQEASSIEFWLDVKARLTDNGTVVANIIHNKQYHDLFSQRISNTFSAVFPHHIRQITAPNLLLDTQETDINMLYIAWGRAAEPDLRIYSDELNSFSLDRWR